MKVKLPLVLLFCVASFSVANAQNGKYVVATAASFHKKINGDPLINKAYQDLYKRAPNVWELNTRNYNNGAWKTYPEIRKYVQQFQSSLKKQRLNIGVGITKNTGQSAIGLAVNNKIIAADIATDVNGNVIAEGGANVIAQTGTNVAADDGHYYVINNRLPGFNFGKVTDPVEPGTKHYTTSGNGIIIVKKAPPVPKRRAVSVVKRKK